MEKEIRKNINEMVKSIGLRLEKSKYGSRSYAKVVFFNGKEIDFIDKENRLYDFLMACKDCGLEGIIKSKKLIEDIRTDNVDLLDVVSDENKGTYFAVEYVVKVGEEDKRFLLFLKRFVDTDIINLYWDNYLKIKKQNVQK